MEIFLTDTPTDADVKAVADGLNTYNEETNGSYDRPQLAVLVRDPETGKVVGGLTGLTSLGVLFVDMFYLPKDLRGTGLGGEILRQGEGEARRRGSRNGVLDTLWLQPPRVYPKPGWRAVGESPR